jgi:hypothetical protein
MTMAGANGGALAGWKGEAMSKRLRVSGNFIESPGQTPVFVSSESLRDFLVIAGNSHDGLMTGCEDAIKALDMGLVDGENDPATQEIIDILEAALAPAREKP